MRRLTFFFAALVPAALLCACAIPPQTGVTRMGDGVLKAADEREAEAYCRNFGEPTRFVAPEGAPKTGPVLFRCD